MIIKIYTQPLWRVAAEILLAVLLWAVFFATLGKRKPKLWRILNLCLLAASVFLVTYMTILRRSAGEHELILLPGNFLREGKRLHEIYRSFLMNILLFTPFGLSLCAVLSSKRKPWRCVALAVLIALGFSLAVETTQFFTGLGRAETDDVLANTFGAFIGALHVPLASAIMRIAAKRNE